MDILAQLSFGAPWMLASLALLPAIWFLLRVTPPMPRRVIFPPLRLLLGLDAKEETPARTPLWLLLLRMLAAALVIVALAQPLLGRLAQIGGKGPVVLFVDNGWTAAEHWKTREAFIGDALRSAARDGRGVVLLATATRPDASLLDAGQAERRAGQLVPEPWTGDRLRAARALSGAHFTAKPEILWLSDDIDDGHARETADLLAKSGALKVFADEASPLALLSPGNTAKGFTATIIRAGHDGTRTGMLEAEGARGEILADVPFRIEDGHDSTRVSLVLPLEIRNQTARLAIAGADSAGAVQLLDSGGARWGSFPPATRRTTSPCSPISIISNALCRPMPICTRVRSRAC